MKRRSLEFALIVVVACAGSYLAAQRRPTSARERLPVEAKAQLGLSEIWLRQNGNNHFVGRGIDAGGGDYDLTFHSAEGYRSRVWSFTATDKRTKQERRGEVRW
jgi:hypothetical protein